jgi:lysophospholipase
VAADGHRIDVPLLFLLGGEDRIVDAQRARAFADELTAQQVKWYPEMFHEVLHDPQREQVMADVLTFLGAHGR